VSGSDFVEMIDDFMSRLSQRAVDYQGPLDLHEIINRLRTDSLVVLFV
jgi:hypothetical protein